MESIPTVTEVRAAYLFEVQAGHTSLCVIA